LKLDPPTTSIVAALSFEAGEVVDGMETLTHRERFRQTQFARSILTGSDIIMYGVLVGKLRKKFHAQLLSTRISATTHHPIRPQSIAGLDAPDSPLEVRTFLGYRRPTADRHAHTDRSSSSLRNRISRSERALRRTRLCSPQSINNLCAILRAFIARASLMASRRLRLWKQPRLATPRFFRTSTHQIPRTKAAAAARARIPTISVASFRVIIIPTSPDPLFLSSAASIANPDSAEVAANPKCNTGFSLRFRAATAPAESGFAHAAAEAENSGPATLG